MCPEEHAKSVNNIQDSLDKLQMKSPKTAVSICSVFNWLGVK